MLFLRKFGALLRGKATPFQIIAGCMLGAMLGFMPGFAHAPGLIVTLSFILIVLNANLLLATTIGLVAKLLSLALLPLSFAVGRFLLDGPTEALFRRLINAPVLALCGFESYVATGGLLLGALFGLVSGGLIARAIRLFRARMANLGQNSERFQQAMAKTWVRVAVWVLAGGGLKTPDYAALQQKKIGNPVRPLGVALVVLTVVLGFILNQFFAASIITTALRSGLEQANGATVNLEGADLDLKAGRLTLTGLAMADPNALSTDLLRATRIEADVSGVNLLRKRLQLDRVVVEGATSGETRRVAGRLTRPAPETKKNTPAIDAETLERYLKNAQVWRERLAQVKQWFDKFAGDARPAPSAAADPTTPAETLAQRLQRFAAEKGYAAVTASHLVDGAPTLLVSELRAAAVKVKAVPGETFDLVARNLSTQPRLTPGAPMIVVTTSSDRIGLNLDLRGLAAAGGANALAFHYRGIPVDSFAGDLKFSGQQPLSGGTVDLSANGSYDAASGNIDLPLSAVLDQTTLTLNGKTIPVSHFTLPIGLTGSLANPRIKVDAKSLHDLALKAGTDALKAKATDALKEKMGGKAGGLLDSFLGGRKKP